MEISAKFVGQNAIVMLGEERLTKKFESKEDRDNLKTLIELHKESNAKDKKSVEKDIRKMFEVVVEQKKEKVKKIKEKIEKGITEQVSVEQLLEEARNKDLEIAQLKEQLKRE